MDRNKINQIPDGRVQDVLLEMCNEMDELRDLLSKPTYKETPSPPPKPVVETLLGSNT